MAGSIGEKGHSGWFKRSHRHTLTAGVVAGALVLATVGIAAADPPGAPNNTGSGRTYTPSNTNNNTEKSGADEREEEAARQRATERRREADRARHAAEEEAKRVEEARLADEAEKERVKEDLEAAGAEAVGGAAEKWVRHVGRHGTLAGMGTLDTLDDGAPFPSPIWNSEGFAEVHMSQQSGGGGGGGGDPMARRLVDEPLQKAPGCDYSDAAKNNNWGWNQSTGKGCPPLKSVASSSSAPKAAPATANTGCDYSDAAKNNNWGWNQSTGKGCPPLKTVASSAAAPKSAAPATTDGCDYSAAWEGKNNGWGWNASTGKGCPPK